MTSHSTARKKSYRKTPTTPVAEAAQALAGICGKGTIAAVAAKIGASEGAVRHWSRGRRTPAASVRRRIAEVYGIAEASWSVPRTAQDASTAPASPASAPKRGRTAGAAPATGGGLLAGLTNRQRLATIIGQLEGEIARCDATVPKNHVASLYSTLAGVVHRLSRLEGEGELTVGALLRSRAWEEIESVLLEILRKHPGAAEDLAQALGTMKKGQV